MDIPYRPRRLRRTANLRSMVRETHLNASQLVYPMFIEEGIEDAVPISTMPGIVRHPEKYMDKAVKEAAAAGIKSILLFGVSHHKDDTGSDSLKEDGLLARMIRRAKDAVPDMTVISDNCFCEYTSHGHCGVLTDDGHVHNDHTLQNLAQQAYICAEAGADIVAPSAMMDGQIAAIRERLDAEGFDQTPIMAYASKFASGLYGPFRAAAGCDLKGDRLTYQMDPANAREALIEAELDEAEGADILMVKPGMFYLDILARIRQQSNLPLAAYQVSGEYSMMSYAFEKGALDEKRVVMESMTALRRAGADILITYFAPRVARWLQE
ncbi:MAG: porphobilinogen synthase [Alphaproteobacteria bacterium]|nr:MAG: porphobilinogen synthase [Alphaproteobacteria bacterium]